MQLPLTDQCESSILLLVLLSLLWTVGCAVSPPPTPVPPLNLQQASSTLSTEGLTTIDAEYLYQERIFGELWIARHKRTIGQAQRELLEISESTPILPSLDIATDLAMYRPQGAKQLVLGQKSKGGVTDILDLNRWYPDAPQLTFDLLRPAPIGQTLAFGFSPLQGHPQGLFIASHSDTQPIQVLNQSVYDVRWSPDANALVVTLKRVNGVSALTRIALQRNSESKKFTRLIEGNPSDQFLTIAEVSAEAAYVVSLERHTSRLLRCGWTDSHCRAIFSSKFPIVDAIAHPNRLLAYTHKQLYELTSHGVPRLLFEAPSGHSITQVIVDPPLATHVVTASVTGYALWSSSNYDMPWNQFLLTENVGDLRLTTTAEGRINFEFYGLDGEVSSWEISPRSAAASVKRQHKLPQYDLLLKSAPFSATSKALIVKPPGSSRGVVLYVYGAYEQLPSLRLRPEWELLLRHGIAVGILVSSADGYYSQEDSVIHRKKEAVQALRSLIAPLQKEFGPVVLWGRSAGAVIASQIAFSEESAPAGLVLEAPLLTLTSVRPDMMPVQEWREWASEPSALEALCPLATLRRRAEAPPFVVSTSTADELIPLGDIARFLALGRTKSTHGSSVLLFLNDDATHDGENERAEAAYEQAKLFRWIETMLDKNSEQRGLPSK